MNKSLQIFFFFFLVTQICFAQWEWQNPLPQGNHLWKIHYSDMDHGTAVGGAEMIIRTTDGGILWDVQESGTARGPWCRPPARGAGRARPPAAPPSDAARARDLPARRARRKPRADLSPPGPEEPADITRHAKAFTAPIRTRAFAFLRAWSIGDDEAALATIDGPGDGDGEPWTADRLRAAREAYAPEHGLLRLDPEARNLRHTHVTPVPEKDTWRVQQMLVDSADLNDWVAEVEVDLAASREENQPVLQLMRLGPLA